MKKAIAIVFSIILILSLVGCSTLTKTSETNSTVNIEKLKEEYPWYFEMNDFGKGIEVYVWKTAEDSYHCGMMSGTNMGKIEAVITSLQEEPLSIEDAKAILAYLGIEKDGVVIIPICQADSGYVYEVDDEYRKQVEKLFR